MDLLRHLRFFVAVAEHRHFGHAAASLAMTQPPVSQGIQRLERHLGHRLFLRDAREVRLTDAGAALLPAARKVLQDADELVAAAHRWKPSSQVRLGLAGDLEDRIPTIVGSLAADGWDVAPLVAGTVDLVEALRDGDLDAAVIRHPAVVDGLHAGQIVALPTGLSGPGLKVSATHDSGEGGGPPALFDLMSSSLPVVVAPRRHHPAAHDQLVDALRRLGHSGAVLEAETVAERVAWAAAGHGFRMVASSGTEPTSPHLPPLRLRVVIPQPTERRVNLDHDGLAARVERELT